ncbi:MAG: hypothetical protein O6949_01800 [Chloroflexi bacterium]|nr:hypothetical protein [Chloroflexota bacterium]
MEHLSSIAFTPDKKSVGANPEKTPATTLRWPLAWSTTLLLVLGILGTALVLYQTRLGPGASGDSAFYLMGARNLIESGSFARTSGGGETYPITGFPPLYSAAIAAVGLMGVDLVAGARILNGILFGVNVFLVGYLILRYTDSIWAALIGSLLTLSADGLFEIHGWMMSEALYLSLMLVALYALAVYIDNARSFLLPVIAILTGLATLTRYVGFSLVATAGISILVFGAGSWRHKIGRSVAVALIGLLPVALWFTRNALLAGTVTNRELAFHLPLYSNLLRNFLAEGSSWIVPHQVPLPTAFRAALAIAIVLVALVAFVRHKIDPNHQADVGRRGGLSQLPWLALLAIGTHLAVLLTNSIFLDAATTLGAPRRYLVPVFILTLLFMVCVSYDLMVRPSKRRILVPIVIVYGLALLGLYAGQTAEVLRDPVGRMGYMGHRIRFPELTSELKSLSPDRPIISNNPEWIYILADRPAYVRPIAFDPYQVTFREDYAQQVQFAGANLMRGGIFVVFGEPEETDVDLIESFSLVPMSSYPIATIYGYEQAGAD